MTCEITMWERRARRARLLASRYESTREILYFYSGMAEWQGSIAREVSGIEGLLELFPSLLELVSRSAPPALADSARALVRSRWRRLLEEYWSRSDRTFSALDFFPRVLLQVYASALPDDERCPWCPKPPQVGALRPMGEGLALSMICSLCLRSRPFPRGRCAGCGESAEERLPAFSARELGHLRLQACETCRGYVPLVDLAREPEALPEVDELLGLPLDLWALDQGYHKLQPNIAGI